jgi:hypothetical protein
MGGYPSGRRYDAKVRVEKCLTFGASWLLQNNYFDLSVGQVKYISLTWRNYGNEAVYTLAADIERVSDFQIRLYLRSTEQILNRYFICIRLGAASVDSAGGSIVQDAQGAARSCIFAGTRCSCAESVTILLIRAA